MNRKIMEPLKWYKHQQLIDALNEFMIAVKLRLYIEPKLGKEKENIEKVIKGHPLPTVEEVDILFNKIRSVLQEDSEPFIKY